MKRFAGAVIAVVLAIGGVMAGGGDARAEGTEFPTCVRVPLGEGKFRVFIDAGTVVRGAVQMVRTGKTQLKERRDGVWVGQARLADSYDFQWHFVFKSDAPKFSDRRWSGWVHCKKVRLG